MASGAVRGWGFSLIEVLAALTILSLALAALIQLFGASSNQLTIGEHYSTATLIAQSKLDVLGIEEKLVEGVSSGDIDDTYRWELIAQRYPWDLEKISRFQVVPYQISLKILWNTGTREHNVTFETLKLQRERK